MLDPGNKLQRNGAAGSASTPNSAATISGKGNTGDDIDIQILQQKKQQAEIKRLLLYLASLDFWFVYQLTDYSNYWFFTQKHSLG